MKFNWKKIKKPILGLSPMADMTDSPYCQIVRDVISEHIKDSRLVIFREMISAEAIVRDNQKTLKMAEIKDKERPIIQQIFGADPENMAKAAAIVEEKYHPDGIDINMGCPVQKLTSSFNGAALMKDPELAAKIVKSVKSAISIPLSVKTRAGWSDHNDCIEFAKILENAGADLITIHGRTRKQAYSGLADRDVVAKAKKVVSIPILYNGDIFTYQDYFYALDQTKCDGALIARGALGNPWIFAQIEQVLANQKPLTVDLEDRIRIVLKHLDLHLDHYRSDKVATFRKHLSWYFKAIPGFKTYKQELMTATEKQEIQEILETLAKNCYK